MLGGSALFAMALGMGVPLLVVGASAGALLPKAGPWMETVKRFFGVLLLGVAIYLVSPLVPPVVEMLAWAALLIVTGIFLRAIDPLPPAARGFERFAKGVGVHRARRGRRVPRRRALGQPRRAAAARRAARRGVRRRDAGRRSRRVSSSAELDRAIAGARGRPVMLDFYADWCVSCKEMERYTFSDAAGARAAGERREDAGRRHGQRRRSTRRCSSASGCSVRPGIVFFDREGREIEGLRVIGFQPAERFARVLDQVLAFERAAQ